MRSYIYTLAASVALTACVNAIHYEEENSGEKARVRASAYTVETITRGALSDAAKRLSWVVVDNGGSVVASVNQNSEAATFGTLDAELPYGSYTLYAVAHSQSADASISKSGVASFAEAKLTDTFCKMRTFTLEKGGKDTLQVHLVRAVAKFAMKCTDAIPADAATMEMVFHHGGDELNVRTGFSTNDPLSEYRRTITIPSSNLGRTNCVFSFFTFLPEAETTISVKATCKDAEGSVLYTREFTDVPLSINHQTTYTGEFFRSGSDFGGSFGVVSEWGEEQNFEF